MTFTYVSLFSGIGGFETALNRLGGKCVLASEIDKFANKAYEVLYGHPTAGDVTKIVAEDVPDHDILVGGFPCQAFSVAGKRLGFDDTRGTLFFEIARSAKTKRPKLLLLENVKGLVSHDKGKTLDTIIQTLNDIGYTVDFNVLNSKYFGVPQNRERIFIVGVLNGETSAWNIVGNDVVAKGKKRIQSLPSVKTFNFDWPAQETVTTRIRDILEDNVAEKYYLSEDKTEKLLQQLNQRASETDEIKCFNPRNTEDRTQTRMQDRVYDTNGVLVSLTAAFSERMNIAEPIQFSNGNGISYCLDANYTKGTAPGDVGKGRRTHVIEEYTVIQKTHGCSTTVKYAETGTLQAARLDKIPMVVREDVRIICDDGLNRKARERFDGVTSPLRAVSGDRPGTWIGEEIRPVLTPDRIEKCQNGRRFKDNDEEMFTLTAQSGHGVAIGKYPNYRIRKLTPLECFRLQGFPDEYYTKLVSANISDSQLYKMAGNAVTVYVIDAIGKRLIPLLGERLTKSNENNTKEAV